MPELITAQGSLELAIFSIDEMLCGIDIAHVQEINKHFEVTPVHHAPSYVRGVVNLRGQIVTVIDLRKKFGLEAMPINEDMRIVIVNSGEESIGILVDGVDDVIIIDPKDLNAPPSNLSGINGAYFKSIYKMDKGLVVILEIEEILKKDLHN